MQNQEPVLNIRRLYDRFKASVTAVDCGTLCAPHNPTGKPFCCDICQAVPAAYNQEWDYLQRNTDLWHAWRGNECAAGGGDPSALLAETPAHMRLLACLGPDRCQRAFRAISCRQFPFFPYVSSDYRLIGLVYEWEFETSCWVISNLSEVTTTYRQEFVAFYDELFAAWPAEFESYYIRSDEMREVFTARRRRIPLLHRNGHDYLVSPFSERMQRVPSERFQKFGPYRPARA
jgi:hypothetical protein